MKLKFLYLAIAICCFGQIKAQIAGKDPERLKVEQEEDSAMSEAYWKLWNPDVQAKIDQDIEQNRKADAVLQLMNIPEGADAKVEQLSHDFIFGAHIFNFNQLGTTGRNQKYKDLYGTLFNSATIAFYWNKFEMQPNCPRFSEEYWDTEKYWNGVKEPKEEPHWRRPSTDQIVAFCESKGIRPHGHPMIWGNRKWQHPEWLYNQFCPANEKEKIGKLTKEELAKLTPAQIGALAPVFFKEMKRLFEKRVVELANYYGGRLRSWDVVNESSVDFHGQSVTGDVVCKSTYGLMPGDYVYNAFKTAGQMLPEDVKLNINDYMTDKNYVNQVKDLSAHGCRVDIIGSQMHLFDPQQCLDIADGKRIAKPVNSPDEVRATMATLAQAGLPIHLSEITITSPGNDDRGLKVQSVIARNLYRLWFSIKPMMGITWWNVVDDCGAPGEPSISGLFTRDMEPKPSYFALDQLINHDWKTNITAKADENGTVKFRGFKGRYRVSWEDKYGKLQQVEFYLKKDGDGQNYIFLGTSGNGVLKGTAPEKFKIYPNPATDVVNVNSIEDKNFTVALYGVDGKKHFEWLCNKKINQLDIKGLERGIYVLRVGELGYNLFNFKLIK